MSLCILFVSYFIGQKDDSLQIRMWNIILKGLLLVHTFRKGTWNNGYLLILFQLLQMQATWVSSGDYFTENENILLYQNLKKMIT